MLPPCWQGWQQAPLVGLFYCVLAVSLSVFHSDVLPISVKLVDVRNNVLLGVKQLVFVSEIFAIQWVTRFQ
jgi:hypothetical protein